MSVTRVGVVVVHGIGEQTRGTTLRQVGEPLYAAIDTLVSAEGGTCRLHHRLDPDGGLSPSVTITVAELGADVEIDVRESRWAERFVPARFGEMQGWLARAGGRVTGRLVGSVRDGGRTLDQAIEVGWFAPLEILSARGWIGPRLEKALTAFLRGYWWVLTGARVLIYLLVSLAIVALALIAGLIPVAIALLVVARFWKATSGRAAAARSALSRSLGDAYVYERRPLESTAIAQQVEADIAAARAEGAQHVVVVAHSLGAVIAHDALSAGDTTDVRQLITLGSGFVPVGRGDPKHPWSHRSIAPLPTVPWLDLYAPFDVVCGGPLARGRGTGPTSAAMASHGVINRSSLLRDHPAYFANVEQVMAVIAERILGLALPSTDPGADDVATRIRRRVGIAAELRRVRKRGQSMLTGAYVLSALGALLTATIAWRRALGARVASALDTPFTVLPDWVEADVRRWTTSSSGKAWLGAALLAALMVLWYVALVAPSWTRWDDAAARGIGCPADGKRRLRLFSPIGLLHAWPVVIGVAVGVWAVGFQSRDGGTGLAAAVLVVGSFVALVNALSTTAHLSSTRDVMRKGWGDPAQDPTLPWTEAARPTT